MYVLYIHFIYKQINNKKKNKQINKVLPSRLSLYLSFCLVVPRYSINKKTTENAMKVTLPFVLEWQNRMLILFYQIKKRISDIITTPHLDYNVMLTCQIFWQWPIFSERIPRAIVCQRCQQCQHYIKYVNISILLITVSRAVIAFISTYSTDLYQYIVYRYGRYVTQFYQESTELNRSIFHLIPSFSIMYLTNAVIDLIPIRSIQSIYIT